MRSMKDQYGSKKGEKVFYASKNKGTIDDVEDETQMNWQNKIYESLTETRSTKNRRKTRDKKVAWDHLKRTVAGKSVGAEGAGRRARTAKALAKKATKPSQWYAKRHHEDEADRLISHGKLLAKNKKVTAKGLGEGTGYRRRWLGQASRDDDITATEAGTIDAAMYAKAQGDKKGAKRLSKKVAKKIAKRREKKEEIKEHTPYDLTPRRSAPKVEKGSVRSKLTGKALRIWDKAQAAKKKKPVKEAEQGTMDQLFLPELKKKLAKAKDSPYTGATLRGTRAKPDKTPKRRRQPGWAKRGN